MADVVIRGLDVPACCAKCNRELAVAVKCIYTKRLVFPREHDVRSGRHPLCPLVPLPEGHGRLGDLDKLDYAFTALRFNEDGSLKHWDDRKNWCLHGSEIETLLANAPTIVPAEGGGEDGQR